MPVALCDPRRHWFRYSLRTVFILLTVLGSGIGWVKREWQIVRERWAMRGWLQSQEAWVVPNILWEELSIRGTWHQTQPRREKLAAIQRRLPPTWQPQPIRQLNQVESLPVVRRWFGDEYVEGIWLLDALHDRRDELQRLFPEATIVHQSEAISDENIERARRIQQTLAEPTRFEFKSASLQDAIDYLCDLHSVDIRLDAQAIANAHIDSEATLSFRAQIGSLGKVLSKLLAPLKLTFVVRHAVVTITTPAGAQEHTKSSSGVIGLTK